MKIFSFKEFLKRAFSFDKFFEEIFSSGEFFKEVLIFEGYLGEIFKIVFFKIMNGPLLEFEVSTFCSSDPEELEVLLLISQCLLLLEYPYLLNNSKLFPRFPVLESSWIYAGQYMENSFP